MYLMISASANFLDRMFGIFYAVKGDMYHIENIYSHVQERLPIEYFQAALMIKGGLINTSLCSCS